MALAALQTMSYHASMITDKTVEASIREGFSVQRSQYSAPNECSEMWHLHAMATWFLLLWWRQREDKHEQTFSCEDHKIRAWHHLHTQRKHRNGQ